MDRQRPLPLSLIVDALENAASADELAELNELLRRDSTARDEVAEFLVGESLLHEKFTNSRKGGTLYDNHRLAAELSEAPAADACGVNTYDGADACGPAARGRGGLRTAFIAIACTLLCAAGLRLWSVGGDAATPPVAGATDAEPQPPTAAEPLEMATIAKVSNLDSAEWVRGTASYRVDDKLVAGQELHLKRGSVQLTFERGTRLTLKGPARLEVTTDAECWLTHGQLAVSVPRSCRGYTVLTPAAELIDLGSEMGVQVMTSGETDLHVFSGEVLARQRVSVEKSGTLVRAAKDEAYRFTLASTAPKSIAVNAAPFLHSVEPTWERHELPHLPETQGLNLWLAADFLPRNLKDRYVSIWPDILAGDNTQPHDAWQMEAARQPRLVYNQQGMPAVRFDGIATYLSTGPIETSDSITALMVIEPIAKPSSPKMLGEMMLKIGSIEPSIELVLMKDDRLRGQVWSGTLGPRMLPAGFSHFGQITGDDLVPPQRSIVGYRYDHSTDAAELILNNNTQGVATAGIPISQNDKCFIGAHPSPYYQGCYLGHFSGDVYEILTYNRRLDDEAYQRVLAYLATRYGVPLAD